MGFTIGLGKVMTAISNRENARAQGLPTEQYDQEIAQLQGNSIETTFQNAFS